MTKEHVCRYLELNEDGSYYCGGCQKSYRVAPVEPECKHEWDGVTRWNAESGHYLTEYRCKKCDVEGERVVVALNRRAKP